MCIFQYNMSIFQLLNNPKSFLSPICVSIGWESDEIGRDEVEKFCSRLPPVLELEKIFDETTETKSDRSRDLSLFAIVCYYRQHNNVFINHGTVFKIKFF